MEDCPPMHYFHCSLLVLQISNVFAGKHGFITPRDLFRWADRGAVGYQELAENGVFILGERLRNQDELNIVRQVLEKNMKVKVSQCTLDRCPPAVALFALCIANNLFAMSPSCWKYNRLLDINCGCLQTLAIVNCL